MLVQNLYLVSICDIDYAPFGQDVKAEQLYPLLDDSNKNAASNNQTAIDMQPLGSAVVCCKCKL